MNDSKLSILNITEIMLWCLFFICSLYVTISTAQLFKDVFYYLSSSSIIAITLIIRKAKVFKWYNFVLGLTYAGCLLHYLLTNRGSLGIHMAYLISSKCLMYGLFALFVIDLINTHNISKPTKNNRAYLAITIIAFSVATIIGLDYIYIIFCPVITWYLTPMSSNDWKKRLEYLSYAIYISFIILVVFSFLKEPSNFLYGRYIGIFVFPVASGLLSIATLLAVYFHWHTFKPNAMHKKKWNIIHAILFLFPFAFLLLTFDRAVILGCLFILLSFFIIESKDNKIVKKRLFCTLAISTILSIAFVIGINIALSQNFISKQKASESTAYSTMPYIIRTLRNTIYSGNRHSQTGVFNEGTVLNALDTFSSNRLGLWVTGIRQSRLWPTGDTQVYLPNGDIIGHAHSTYIFWIMKLGFLGGSFLIVWFLSSLVASVKNEMKYPKGLSLSTMWTFFCLGFFIAERELWSSFPLFFLLLLQHPFIIDGDE